MCKLTPIPFHNDTIFCVAINDQPYTPAKPIVENMGISWQGQQAKLSANKERWGIKMILIPSESGEQETICIPVRKLPAFLASINPKKVRAEIREKIELYQNECDDALWDYWTNGRAERKPHNQPTQPALPPLDAPITPDQQCTLQALVKSIVERIPEKERPKGLYPQIWSRFKNHFRVAKYDQLPQSRLSEAIEYLTKMELTDKKKELPQENTIPALPEEEYPPRSKKTMKRIETLLHELHSLRYDCNVDTTPSGYSSNDNKGSERAAIENNLNNMIDLMLCASWQALKASARIKEWA